MERQRRSMKTVLIFLTGLMATLAAWADPPSPNFETVVEDVVFNTSSRVVLDEKLIKDSRAPDLTTLLSSQANITIATRPFQPNLIYIRGSDASHILILVDGVPFYDAATTQRTFNLNSLDIKSIRRIEIIKGPQTTLYGGQALGGVISIETLPENIQSQQLLQTRVGQNNLSDAAVGIILPTQESNGLYLRAQAGQFKTESPVLDSSKTYSHIKTNSEAAYMWRGPVQAYLKAHYISEKNETPNMSRTTNALYDAEDLEQKSQQLGVSSVIKFSELPWTPSLGITVVNGVRQFDQPVNSTNTSLIDQDYGSNLQTLRLNATPLKNDTATVLVGASYLYEDFFYRDLGIERNNSFAEQRGLFTKLDYNLNADWSLAAGVRSESWEKHDPVSTYQVGITAYKNTKLEFATGYKIPSLFQLFSSYGNPDLKEEKSNQYSLTQDIPLAENQSISATIFYSEFSNLIVAQQNGYSFKYANVNKSETRGAELSYNLRPTSDSSLLVTYGYQEPKDIDNNRWLQYRPLVNGSIRYTQTWNKHVGSLEILGAGERLDRAGTNYISLPGYTTANAAYTYNWDENLALYARLNNLTNQRYQESYTSFSQSFTAFVGLDFSL